MKIASNEVPLVAAESGKRMLSPILHEPIILSNDVSI